MSASFNEAKSKWNCNAEMISILEFSTISILVKLAVWFDPTEITHRYENSLEKKTLIECNENL